MPRIRISLLLLGNITYLCEIVSTNEILVTKTERREGIGRGARKILERIVKKDGG
jgi:hypothetical protein